MATTETKPYFRFLSIEDEEIKDDILTMSVSSEYPVKRGFGEEILEHTPEAIDLKRFNDNAPILWSHNVSEQVGVIERAYLVDKKLKVDMRFGNSAKAKEIEADVRQKIICDKMGAVRGFVCVCRKRPNNRCLKITFSNSKHYSY